MIGTKMRIQFVERDNPPSVLVVKVLAKFSSDSQEVNRDAARMFAETYDKSFSQITHSPNKQDA
jgi:hypothetical protein